MTRKKDTRASGSDVFAGLSPEGGGLSAAMKKLLEYMRTSDGGQAAERQPEMKAFNKAVASVLKAERNKPLAAPASRGAKPGQVNRKPWAEFERELEKELIRKHKL